jgi:hypothetical protein
MFHRAVGPFAKHEAVKVIAKDPGCDPDEHSEHSYKTKPKAG